MLLLYLSIFGQSSPNIEILLTMDFLLVVTVDLVAIGFS